MTNAPDRSRLVCLGLVLAPLGLFSAATPAAQPFLVGMVDAETSHVGRWYRRIYGEALKRLGLRMELASYPTQRIGALLDQGSIDAETARARIYAQAHPELIRVDESVFDIAFALYAASPAIAMKRLEDVRALKLRAACPRGVLYCEKALQSVLPPEQIFDTTQTDQGLLMLLSGRIDVFCAVDIAVQSALAESADLKGVTSIRQVMVLEAAPLYPYLHRKHAELAPRLAATLKEMKAQGLIERYRLEALREVGR